jgi:DNA-binding transcriptional LysR family regulator
LRWSELGVMDWVFAIAPRHPLAREAEPLEREAIDQHRAIVVADSTRRTNPRGYGVLGGQAVMAVPTMRAKILAQCAGLGVGWLPRQRVAGLLKHGTLVERRTADPREPNTLYVAWRGDQRGKALAWWVEQLKQPRLRHRLVAGIEVAA